ncbi:TRAP transporter small permease [Pseudooceanicola marinus]|uniref:TRAP transporter small permease n=1 Tax=Pseudooceanicola marinus TaxID=396013 RepID=UPI001C980A6D|nr:TRAP transporter small permease [Pseudooceanicola marinus]MBY5974814.1 TRAP transporter small permease [Ferrimonas balearica]MCA1336549.1 TRAP transporter small permease [Pseudooceanicola marinus]
MTSGRFERRLAGALGALAILAGLVTALLTGFLVLARFINYSVVGLHELILTAAVLFYMLGAILASRNRAHLAVDFIDQLLTTPRARAIHALVVAVLTVIVTCFFIWWTWEMFAWGMRRPQWTPAYQIPLWLPQLSIMIGAVGCFAYGLRDVVLAVLDLRQLKG